MRDQIRHPSRIIWLTNTPTNTARPANTTMPASSVFVATPGNSTGGEPVAYVPFPPGTNATAVVRRTVSSTSDEDCIGMLCTYTSVSDVGIAPAVPVWLTSSTVSECACAHAPRSMPSGQQYVFLLASEEQMNPTSQEKPDPSGQHWDCEGSKHTLWPAEAGHSIWLVPHASEHVVPVPQGREDG